MARFQVGKRLFVAQHPASGKVSSVSRQLESFRLDGYSLKHSGIYDEYGSSNGRWLKVYSGRGIEELRKNVWVEHIQLELMSSSPFFDADRELESIERDIATKLEGLEVIPYTAFIQREKSLRVRWKTFAWEVGKLLRHWPVWSGLAIGLLLVLILTLTPSS